MCDNDNKLNGGCSLILIIVIIILIVKCSSHESESDKLKKDIKLLEKNTTELNLKVNELEEEKLIKGHLDRTIKSYE